MNTEFNIQLTKTQSDFLAHHGLFAQYQGGLGAGKTKILVIWGFCRASMGRYVLITEPTHQMVRDVLANEFIVLFEELGVQYTYNKSDQTIEVGGGKIYMRSGEAPERMRGINADDFGMDEVSSQSRETFDIGSARAGRRLNDGKEQWRVVGTPRGRDWVHTMGLDYGDVVFRQSTFKNPFLSDTYKQNMLKQYTKEFARQELFGEIVDFSAGVIRSKWFTDLVDYPVLHRSCRSWDLAFTTKKSSDFTASCLMTLDSDSVYLHDLFRVKSEWPQTRRTIIETAHADGQGVPIVIESIAGQIALISDLQNSPELRNFTIIPFNPKGDKLNRAMGWVSKSERGRFFVMPSAKKDYFYIECDQFTANDTHDHDDCVDAVSQAYNYLMNTSLAVSGNIKGI